MQIFNRMVEAVQSFLFLLKHPDEQTYYPTEPRKGSFRIFCDQMAWLFRHHEINHFYYLYGFDRKKAMPLDVYISKRKFFTTQAVVNGPVRINGRKIFYGCLLQDKFIFTQYLKSLRLPTAQTYGFCEKGSIHWLSDRCRQPVETLNRREGLDVFIKPILGKMGTGIIPLEVRGGVVRVQGRSVEASELTQLLQERFVVQSRIEQHPELNRLSPNSVCSLRIITAIGPNGPDYISSLLAIGTGSGRVSNWAAGGVTVGVIPETGTLCPYAFYKPSFGRRIDKHPDTGVMFGGFAIPYFKEAVEMAKKAHRYFYGTHSIGWDIAISPTGPVFLEGNNLWEIGALQIDDHHCVENYLASLPGGSK